MRIYDSPFRIMRIHLDSTESTQIYAKKHQEDFVKEALTCISAEEQTQGYGRQKRRWISPKGVNLYATLAFRLPSDTVFLSCLAILLARSLSTLLEKKGLHPHVKWPNDVLIQGKKMAGILCETEEKQESVFPNDFSGCLGIQVFLGIGINVNMTADDCAAIDQPATSLLQETGHPWDKQALLQELLEQFTNDLRRCLQSEAS